jgi:hypothetical protein
MALMLDLDPDIADEGTYGFCHRCECEVPVVRRDFGIGRDEAWGRPIIHVDMQWCCVECGDQI